MPYDMTDLQYIALQWLNLLYGNRREHLKEALVLHELAFASLEIGNFFKDLLEYWLRFTNLDI